ncbi:T9SS type A sorting domain-containing protein [Hymenobacter sp. J193]|uniref:T9SS type A sorting domain-containing protein n=1 Tax=Hymenobacter sp. J193 TaxID=2898429 RepID=UPI0021514964|nr:T9SS type A sorting domain-containing protein [Hymenobacter sp. J193]MCR5889866.1 T9SS type A sorting domain-containing protein [Hymenobacter sp. J193]
MYEIQLRGTVTASRPTVAGPPLRVYPNPSQGQEVQLSRPAAGALYNPLGQLVRTFPKTARLSTAGMTPGVYLLRTTDGTGTRLVVQ